MRIAHISYEYPPDTAFGGIATYIRQAAVLLAERGHSVEVFAASNKRSGYIQDGNVGINLVAEMDRTRFGEAIAPIFAQRNLVEQFDVVESPEYFADGRSILRLFPDIPQIVKLHTPSQLIRNINSCPIQLTGILRHTLNQLRIAMGAMRRGKRPTFSKRCQTLTSMQSELELLERNYVKQCHFIVSPSEALIRWAIREWGIAPTSTMVVPNPYIPSTDLLSTSTVSGRHVVGFFGRLEYRKGMCDLVAAVPSILKAVPSAMFRIVGMPSYHPGTLESFEAYILRSLKRYRSNITIVGPICLQRMPLEYDKVDVCVIPSIWENFPNVCLEAMSAAKAIVASSSGGMAEMLDAECGVLIPPHHPKALADSVIHMLKSDCLRAKMGYASRKRVLERYSAESIGPIIEESYRRAMLM